MAICRGQYSWPYKRQVLPREAGRGPLHLLCSFQASHTLSSGYDRNSQHSSQLPVLWWKIFQRSHSERAQKIMVCHRCGERSTHTWTDNTQERSTDVLSAEVKDYWSPGKLQSHGIIQQWTPWETPSSDFEILRKISARHRLTVCGEDQLEEKSRVDKEPDNGRWLVSGQHLQLCSAEAPTQRDWFRNKTSGNCLLK